MTEQDINSFKSLMMGLGDYKSKEITKPLLNIYWRKLKHLTFEQVQHAIDGCVDDCTYFPTVPEIIQHLPKQERLETAAKLTWCANTQKLIREYGVKK